MLLNQLQVLSRDDLRGGNFPETGGSRKTSPPQSAMAHDNPGLLALLVWREALQVLSSAYLLMNTGSRFLVSASLRDAGIILSTNVYKLDSERFDENIQLEKHLVAQPQHKTRKNQRDT